jgi:hypothetical protein
MGDNNKSKIQFNPLNLIKKKEVTDDTNPKGDTDPKTWKEKPAWMTRVGKRVKESSTALANTVVNVGKNTGNKIKELTGSARVIAEKLAKGEEVTMTEVWAAATDMGMLVGTVSTGGAVAAFTPELSDAILNYAIKAEIIDEGTGDNVKQVLKLSSADGLHTALMASAIQASATNNPNDIEKLKEQIKNILVSNKKPGSKLSDKYANADYVAEKAIVKTKPKLRTRDEIIEAYRAHIGKKITAVNEYLIKTSETGYNGLGVTLRNEVRDALLQIYIENTNSITIYNKNITQINKMYEILREYSSGGYHVDGKVTSAEYNKLNLFMKQYLTHNGSINLPSSSSSASQELENNSAIQALGGANYGGPGGMRMETLSGEVIWAPLPLPGTHSHQVGETVFELELRNESHEVIQTLEFSEYMGDASCEVGTCGKCKELSAVSNINAVFDHAETELQVWFDVDGLGQRGYEFPISDIDVTPSKVASFKLKLKETSDSSE